MTPILTTPSDIFFLCQRAEGNWQAQGQAGEFQELYCFHHAIPLMRLLLRKDYGTLTQKPMPGPNFWFAVVKLRYPLPEMKSTSAVPPFASSPGA